MTEQLPFYSDWPTLTSAIPLDQQIEKDIEGILQQMTLEEKIGQMIQPDIRNVSLEEIRKYKLGSLLNGGGAWPNGDRYATSKTWSELAENCWQACEKAFADRPFRIPFLWATDAVHGHNNVVQATIFPHNIGLGAAHDPELIKRIAEITATEIAVTGLDWTFAPTVATPRHYNWGRVYEGYSEDPELVHQYASKVVEGLQGSAQQLMGDGKVLATAKHWIGDGGTQDGVDRGENHYSELALINLHGPGYYSAIEAGVQTVMASFNSWHNEANYDHDLANASTPYNYKIHGSRYLLNDVLKQKIGFDGLIVSDWSGHAEISACACDNADYAVNAGIDMLMIPEREDWQAVYQNLIIAVKQQRVSEHRINDAVQRILRVKQRAGLWEKASPAQRTLAGKQTLLGQQSHQAVAREAVRKSLVLLKNNQQLLPLSRKQKVLIAGSAVDDIQKQTGGWSITWQGDETSKQDFPNAATLKDALINQLGQQQVIDFNEQNQHKISDIDVAIVVIGESPYAEMVGDLKHWQSLEFASLKHSYQQDHDTVIRLKKMGYKVVTLFYSGRPLYVNNEINHSDAFIAAWLPGSEAEGITDVLFKDNNEQIAYDFNGKLSFSWPNKKYAKNCHRTLAYASKLNVHTLEQDNQTDNKPLFEYGYGLSYQHSHPVDPALSNNSLVLDKAQPVKPANKGRVNLFGVHKDIECELFAQVNELAQQKVSNNSTTALDKVVITPINYQHQQDARRIKLEQGQSLHLRILLDEAKDLNLKNVACFELELCVHHITRDATIELVPDHAEASLLKAWQYSPVGQWKNLNVPLKQDAISSKVDELVLTVSLQGQMEVDLGAISGVLK
ncbi:MULTISPECIES: glycoside hydrolase family 3 protein [unclassified Agarivorans]|uniref:glycoside hydrolase family 3 protein n=1 Tax=unclassified Agarivorans TaxID=2636026 RepID=UPI0026E1CF17|nr:MULTISPECIES: glycoside hydrolase family 3 protein [unclassified Agarivorans]MDO6684653.1 glycoside hydrolase family 3 protein [Agarivorans sp. 3_MG-2023]MDO6714818.1 glycoside hydrolase family 3 protein [Agarivorans sp. 2_MG-2023]